MFRNLNHLVTFAALAQTGSFSGAARKLGLPPSTVTSHIAALEESLDVQLVVRTTRKSRLTEIGKALAKDAERVVAASEAAIATVEADKVRPSGTLRISVPFTFAVSLFGPLIGKFAARHPGLDLDIRISNEYADLIADGIDVAVRIGPLADSGLIGRRIAKARQCIVATPDYLETRGTPRSPNDLHEHSVVGLRRRQTIELVGPNGPVSIVLESRIFMNDVTVASTVVASGAGIAVLPHFLIASRLRRGELSIILPDYRPATVELTLVYHGRSARDPRVDLFRAFVLEELGRFEAFEREAAHLPGDPSPG